MYQSREYKVETWEWIQMDKKHTRTEVDTKHTHIKNICNTCEEWFIKNQSRWPLTKETRKDVYTNQDNLAVTVTVTVMGY